VVSRARDLQRRDPTRLLTAVKYLASGDGRQGGLASHRDEASPCRCRHCRAIGCAGESDRIAVSPHRDPSSRHASWAEFALSCRGGRGHSPAMCMKPAAYVRCSLLAASLLFLAAATSRRSRRSRATSADSAAQRNSSPGELDEGQKLATDVLENLREMLAATSPR